MRHSLKVGFSFGLTSGIITTLGLIVGLYYGTYSKVAVIGGVLTVAIADAFSDALGIHISEESEAKHKPKEIWEATLSTFLSKFIFALTFIIPLLLFKTPIDIAISIIWGLSLLSVFSFFISRNQKMPSWKVVIEHLTIAFMVIFVAYYVGRWISVVFN